MKCDLLVSKCAFKWVNLYRYAVAVPQARWIGERLMHPYELKFSRHGGAGCTSC
jgi:hypothetical protein